MPDDASRSAEPPVFPRTAAVDIARGFALVSMFVAHTAPTGGPLDLLNLSEFLTAPLFAVLVGVGVGMSASRARSYAGVVARATVRGAGLLLVAWALMPLDAQVVDVLRYLGLLTLVLALVARLPASVLGAGALLTAAVSPEIVARCRPDGTAQSWLLSFLCHGPYFGHTMLIWGLLGLIAARWLRSKPSTRQQLGLLLIGLVLAGAVSAFKQRNPWDVVPYSGSRLELALEAGLIAILLAACLLGAHLLPRAVRAALVQLGRMSLSVYALHVAALALVVTQQPTDDSWAVLVGLIVGALAVAWAWLRFSLGRGPLESVLDRLTDGAARVLREHGNADARPSSPSPRTGSDH